MCLGIGVLSPCIELTAHTFINATRVFSVLCQQVAQNHHDTLQQLQCDDEDKILNTGGEGSLAAVMTLLTKGYSCFGLVHAYDVQVLKRAPPA